MWMLTMPEWKKCSTQHLSGPNNAAAAQGPKILSSVFFSGGSEILLHAPTSPVGLFAQRKQIARTRREPGERETNWNGPTCEMRVEVALAKSERESTSWILPANTERETN